MRVVRKSGMSTYICRELAVNTVATVNAMNTVWRLRNGVHKTRTEDFG